ncbi:uracil-xanthine permease family protein [Planosporangium sp. 12N6]|uniref:uracil-xanthine permease family protein n=1 Tax=Planosporangium spinosum TaxID=3402278 RepID=UPI003CF4A127
MIDLNWRLHGDGRHTRPGEVVAPDERLSWPRTIGIGAQHVLAMFGATFLVPLITHFPPSTTLFFSGIGTILFLLITGNRLPSYLGSSFAFIAPVAAASASHGMPSALGGIIVAGALFAIIGFVVHKAGTGWIEWLMPPVVTGAIVALIGLNLAPVAKSKFVEQPGTAFVTLVVILLVTVVFAGLLGRLSILVGVVAGYVAAAFQGQLDFTAVRQAAWVGLPDFTAPTFNLGVVALFVPVVLVLIAENVGHVKAVAAMTGRPLDHLIGRAFVGDGLATVLAGAGGGSGTTTYAENIGVMAATRVYSTAAYWVAGIVAFLLGLSPKFGALINTIPPGVLGGATVVLYGLIGVLGARIWVQSRVDFNNPANLMTAAVALIIGIADFTWKIGDLAFNGIALGSVAAIVVYHVMRQIGIRRGTVSPVGTLPEPAPQPVATAGQRGQNRRKRRP